MTLYFGIKIKYFKIIGINWTHFTLMQFTNNSLKNPSKILIILFSLFVITTELKINTLKVSSLFCLDT